jgi:16S rRNA (guanine966-N2)-methyltransferase
MRVVGGKLRSRPIAGPKSDAVRPTSDRLREALFNILTHSYGDPVTGGRVLAISRGADYALFVDEGVEARALLRDNVESLGLGGVTRIFRRDATKLGPAHPLEPFSLIFLDPPYGKSLAEKSLISAHDGGWLVPQALVVVEEATDAGFKAPEGFIEAERRQYDDTEFTFLRLS